MLPEKKSLENCLLQDQQENRHGNNKDKLLSTHCHYLWSGSKYFPLDFSGCFWTLLYTILLYLEKHTEIYKKPNS